MELNFFLFTAVFIWLGVVTWFLFKTRRHYLDLVSHTRKYKIDEILETLINSDKMKNVDIDKIKKDLQKFEEEIQFHFQKIGLIRFNPFAGMGGEQSFVIALVNKRNSGVVINFIYTRDGLRVYSKKVKEGVGDKLDLSDEEKEAIKKSQHY